MPTLRKIKRSVLPTHKATHKTPHLILPNRNTTLMFLDNNFDDFKEVAFKN
jgi:hypothetical protein